MDDLNKKRLEKGQPLSVYGKDQEQVNELMTEAVQACGYNGRTYCAPRTNPVGDFRISEWLPFGECPDYGGPTEVSKLVGYQLVSTQTHEDDEWFHLYFDSEKDRGGCLRRVDIFDQNVDGICRSDVLDGGMVDPLSDFTRAMGCQLIGIEAFRSGRFVFHFLDDRDAGADNEICIERKWNSPLDLDMEPSSPVRKRPRKADFHRVLVAFTPEAVPEES